jgi:hypothetical protein
MPKRRGALYGKHALTEAQKKLAEAELELYLDALRHDEQHSVRRSVFLIQVLCLPWKVSRAAALVRLSEELGRRRERQRWGKPWPVRLLARVFYGGDGGQAALRNAWKVARRPTMEEWVKARRDIPPPAEATHEVALRGGVVRLRPISPDPLHDVAEDVRERVDGVAAVAEEGGEASAPEALHSPAPAVGAGGAKL